MNAAAVFQRERDDAETAIHMGRIAWLSKPAPVWSCGATVPNSFRLEMLRSSCQKTGTDLAKILEPATNI